MPLQLGAPPVSEQIHPLFQSALQSQQRQHELEWQTQQQRHELQMRVGLQLAQLKQRDLQFQAQESRLQETSDRQFMLDTQLRLEQARRNASIAQSRQIEESINLAGAGKQKRPNPEYKYQQELGDLERRMAEKGITQQDDAYYTARMQHEDKWSRIPENIVEDRPNIVPAGKTIENPGVVKEWRESDPLHAAMVPKDSRYDDVPMEPYQRGNAPMTMRMNPEAKKAVDDQIAAEKLHGYKLNEIKATKSYDAGGIRRSISEAQKATTFYDPVTGVHIGTTEEADQYMRTTQDMLDKYGPRSTQAPQPQGTPLSTLSKMSVNFNNPAAPEDLMRLLDMAQPEDQLEIMRTLSPTQLKGVTDTTLEQAKDVSGQLQSQPAPERLVQPTKPAIQPIGARQETAPVATKPKKPLSREEQLKLINNIPAGTMVLDEYGRPLVRGTPKREAKANLGKYIREVVVPGTQFWKSGFVE